MNNQPWLDIEEHIFLNQVAQGVHPAPALSAWFDSLPQSRRGLVLQEFTKLIRHAKPVDSDGIRAVQESGLKSTLTPCSLLAKGANQRQFAKLCLLPETEQSKAIVLLMALYRIADRRCREQEGNGVEQHWWHQDLSNHAVLAEVRRRAREGQL